MRTPISFFVAGTPKGQPRARAFAVKGSVRMYDPGTAESWKGEIAIAARPFVPSEPWDGALHLDLRFEIPRPRSHYRGKTNEVKFGAPKYHIIKPDGDNFAKAVMDAMTLLRFWRDDCQASAIQIVKLYSGGRTGCLITIRELEG